MRFVLATRFSRNVILLHVDMINENVLNIFELFFTPKCNDIFNNQRAKLSIKIRQSFVQSPINCLCIFKLNKKIPGLTIMTRFLYNISFLIY